MLHVNNLQLWNTTNPHYACAELAVQYQGALVPFLYQILQKKYLKRLEEFGL